MKDANERDEVRTDATPEDATLANRRELVTQLGKFAAYAAPFTILAVTGKAAKGRGHGSGGGPH